MQLITPHTPTVV